MRSCLRRCCFLFIVVLGLFGALGPSVSKASSDALTRLLPKSCNISGEFEQRKYLKSVPAPLVSTGSFFFACQAGLIWHTTEPYDEALVHADGDTLFQVRDAQYPRILKGMGSLAHMKLLIRLLTADIDYLENEFTIASNDTHVQLVPKSRMLRKAIKTVTISVDGNTATPGIAIKLEDIHDQLVEFNISDTRNLTGEPQSDSAKPIDLKRACIKAYEKADSLCDMLWNPTNWIDEK